MRVFAKYAGDYFGLSTNFDNAIVVKLQTIAVAKQLRFWQIEKKLKPSFTNHRYAATPTALIIKYDMVSRLTRPLAARHD